MATRKRLDHQTAPIVVTDDTLASAHRPEVVVVDQAGNAALGGSSVQGTQAASVSPECVKAAITTGTLAAGVVFAPYACQALVIGGYAIDVDWQRTTTGISANWMRLPAGAFYTVTGITDAGQVRVRRNDQAATAIDLIADALRKA